MSETASQTRKKCRKGLDFVRREWTGSFDRCGLILLQSHVSDASFDFMVTLIKSQPWRFHNRTKG